MGDIQKYIEDLYETNKFGYKYVRFDRTPHPELVDLFKKEYDINTNCHHTCITCQITHILKYKNELELQNHKSLQETGKPLPKWFTVNCNYIPAGLTGNWKSELTQISHNLNIDVDKAKKILLSTIDVAAWTELMFGFDDKTKDNNLDEQWYLRWYQKMLLRCSAQRIVARAGRRVGKSSSIALKLIHFAFNKKVFAGYNSNGDKMFRGPEIIIITPFSSQVKRIFADIEKFIKTNQDLESQVKSRAGKLFTQTPPLSMEFANGASITGYIAGANAKDDETGGGAIRGDNADIIYLDEMDMIPESTLQSAINPLLLTRPNVMMLASSTPIGKKASFYKWSLERIDFKEIYAPSTVLPHWHLVEKESTDEATEDTFKAEYMADFIEQQAGVFKHIYIQEARTDYSYEEADSVEFWNSRNENYYEFIKCIGVDWNKTAGTEFVVVGFSPRSGRIYVLETLNVSHSQYSAEVYKDEFKRLNYKWKPNYIYPDEGYGHHLIEELQVESINMISKSNRSGWEDSIAHLNEKIFPINFSSNLELFNPGTGTYFKKYAKNYLVENAQNLLEKGRIKYPENEKILIKQLGNYIVKDQKDTGKIIYGQNNEVIGDHRLDAFMLAIGGLALKESIFNADYSPVSKTYMIESESEMEYSTAMEDALDILNIIKKGKSGIQQNVLAIVRGNGDRELERRLTESDKELKQKLTPRHVFKPVIENESNKGYFSSRGEGTFSSKHSRDEDIDMSRPMKIEHNPTRSPRTNLRRTK